jgi:hypothetical protein
VAETEEFAITLTGLLHFLDENQIHATVSP